MTEPGGTGQWESGTESEGGETQRMTSQPPSNHITAAGGMGMAPGGMLGQPTVGGGGCVEGACSRTGGSHHYLEGLDLLASGRSHGGFGLQL